MHVVSVGVLPAEPLVRAEDGEVRACKVAQLLLRVEKVQQVPVARLPATCSCTPCRGEVR